MKKARGKDVLGAILIAVAFAGLAAAGVALALLRPPPSDPETLCRTDAPLAAHTIVLIDATDTLEPRHRKRLDAAIAQERARLKPYEKLTVLALRPEAPKEPRVLFSRCLPRDGTLANPLYENPKRAQERWENSIGRALRAAVRQAGSGGAKSASPIAAGIAAIGADPDFSSAIPHRRLVLISDLLEHQPGGFSLYQAGADYAAYAKTHPQPPALAGVAIRVAPLDRPGQSARQDSAIRAFWRPLLAGAGATEISWDPIG